MNKFITAFIFLILSAAAPVRAQLVAGAGPQYYLPAGALSGDYENSWGGTAFIESRKYCNLWPGLRLDYLRLVSDTSLNVDPRFDQAIIFSPEAKIFFWQPVSLPLYLQAQLMISGIRGDDEASRLGLGAALGAGYLFFYSDNCSPWFLDLNVRYIAPNGLLRADERPSFEALNLNLSFNFAL